jgi:pumilio family protein 6
VLLQLLAPDSHRYLPQSTYEMLHPPAKSMMVSAAAAAAAAGGGSGAAAGIDDDDEVMDDEAADEPQQDIADDEGAAAGDGAAGDGSSQLVQRELGESRKDPTQRRRELLSAGGKDSLAAALLALCAEQGAQLLCNQVGADVVVEVARGAAGGVLWELQQQGVEAVHAAVVQQVAADCSRVASQPGPAAAGKKQKAKKGKAAAGDADAGEQDAAEAEQQQEPLLTQYFASRALRRLLLAGGSEGADGAGARAFAQQLWQQALQGQCEQLVGSHAEKVLAGLLHCGEQAVQQQAAAELQPLVGDVEAWAAKFWGPAGGQEQQHHSKTKDKKKAKAQQKQQKEQPQQNGTPAPSAKKKKQRQQ